MDREAERGEDDDLAQRRERGVEALDLALERHARIADPHAGHEHGQEPRPVQQRRAAVDQPGERERPQRVQALARQRVAPHRPHQHERAHGADGDADDHLEAEVGGAPPRGCPGRRVGEQADHERDCDRVVRARLALEDGRHAAADVAPGEHREHHGRVGRRERGADDRRGRPRHRQDDLGGDRAQRSGQEGADDAEQHDRPQRRPQPSPADLDAAVEQDRDQRDHADALDVADRDRLGERGQEVRDRRGRDQEDDRRRHAQPGGQARRHERQPEAGGDDGEHDGEVMDLAHDQGSTSPRATSDSIRPAMPAGFVGILSFELHLPDGGSLKGKRKHLLHTKAQLERRFGASVAEVDYHDRWQRSRLTMAIVRREHNAVQQALVDAQSYLSGQEYELVDSTRTVLSVESDLPVGRL